MRLFTIIFFFFLSTFSFAQNSDKKIIFKSDSIWYGAKDEFLFSSTDKGERWDTIFKRAEKSTEEKMFFLCNGPLDTSVNISFPDQRTIFIFGWDGTYFYSGVLFCSNDCGKSWTRTRFEAQNSEVTSKYLVRVSEKQFFLYLKNGYYATSYDSGQTWKMDKLEGKFQSFSAEPPRRNGKSILIYAYYDTAATDEAILSTDDGGKNWLTTIKD